MTTQHQVLEFWFGTLDGEGLADTEHRQGWWKKDPAFDALIRSRFGELHAALHKDEHADWRSTAQGALAEIIVLDQFSRNMFRDTDDMFASDALAQRRCLALLEQGFDQSLAVDEKVFAYMPLMHAEDLERQNQCVGLFETLLASLPAGKAHERIAGNLDFAERHRDIIHDWGRFPHRNAILDRTSTSEELAFLETEGSRF